MLINTDWFWLMLIPADSCWFLLIRADSCWFILSNADSCSNKVKSSFLLLERTSAFSPADFYIFAFIKPHQYSLFDFWSWAGWAEYKKCLKYRPRKLFAQEKLRILPNFYSRLRFSSSGSHLNSLSVYLKCSRFEFLENNLLMREFK